MTVKIGVGWGTVVADRWDAVDPVGSVILLHGIGQTRHSWRTSGQRFADAGWSAVAVDARGHGDSDWSADSEYGIPALAEDLLSLLGCANEPIVAVGASMGGLTALYAAAEQPSAFAGLVLLDVSTKIEPAGRARVFDFMASAPDGFASLAEAADAIKAFRPSRSNPVTPNGLRRNLRQHADGRWRWHWDPALLRPQSAAERASTIEQLESMATHVAVPTLLVRGRESDVVSRSGMQGLQSLMPNAEMREVDGGHMIAGDSSDVFVTTVLEFVARIAPQRCAQDRQPKDPRHGS